MFKQTNECILYEQFSLQMRKLNDEQSFIVDDILLKKPKTHQNLYIFFYQIVQGQKKRSHLFALYKVCYSSLHKINDKC